MQANWSFSDADFYELAFDLIQCMFYCADLGLTFWICDAVAKEVGILYIYSRAIQGIS